MKNDRVDAGLIAETLRIGQYDPTRLATDEVRSLRSLTRCRQSPKAGLAEVKTRRTCLPDSYSPELPGAFSDVFGAAGRAAPSKSPPPSQVARRRADSLQRDISEAARGSRRMDGKAAELEALAKGSVGIRLGEGAAAMQVRSPVRQTDFLDGERAKVERGVRELLELVEPLALAIPGVSYTAGAQIVAETGDVARFRGAAALVSCAGPNSSVNQSGRLDGGGGPITGRGSPCLRRALRLAASRAWQSDPSLRAFYDRKRAEGKCHRVAVTAVARKLCHIVFAAMRDGAPTARRGRAGTRQSIRYPVLKVLVPIKLRTRKASLRVLTSYSWSPVPAGARPRRHSLLSASTGSACEALRAGRMPAITVSATEMTTSATPACQGTCARSATSNIW